MRNCQQLTCVFVTCYRSEESQLRCHPMSALHVTQFASLTSVGRGAAPLTTIFRFPPSAARTWISVVLTGAFMYHWHVCELLLILRHAHTATSGRSVCTNCVCEAAGPSLLISRAWSCMTGLLRQSYLAEHEGVSQHRGLVVAHTLPEACEFLGIEGAEQPPVI